MDTFLSMLYMCYKEMDKRFAVVHGKKITKKSRIEATVLNSLTPMSGFIPDNFNFDGIRQKRTDGRNYVEPDISVICDEDKLDEKGCHRLNLSGVSLSVAWSGEGELRAAIS